MACITSPWCRTDRVADAACGRLLVGQGDDTYDPTCVRPEGHDGLCKPEPHPSALQVAIRALRKDAA